jgi:hypothetical protein
MFFAPAVVNGSEVHFGDRFTDLDPATGQPLAEVLRGKAGDVGAAVDAEKGVEGLLGYYQTKTVAVGL